MRLAFAIFTTSLFSFSNFSVAAECLDSSALQKLNEQEIAYMLNRIPPAFSDAVADKKIEFIMQAAEAGTCKVNFKVTLPEEDVKEANALLEADPAKKIILFSQGYALPETTTLNAVFLVDPASFKINHADILQSGELGKLRASVEMVYAMLTQKRADVDETVLNNQPWSKEFRQQTFEKCSNQFASIQQVSAGCECQISKTAAVVSERQMRYVEYVNSNPYAQATGASRNFAELKSRVQLACGLIKK